MSRDSTVITKNQRLDGGDRTEISGVLNIDSTNGGVLKLDGTDVTDAVEALAGQPINISLSPAAGSTNVCIVTITVTDAAGDAIAKPAVLDVWLSDAATGAGLTATTASGAVAAGASGTDLVAMVAKKALRVLTTAAGVYALSITDSAKTGFYVAAALGGRLPTVSSQLVTANYG